MVNHTEPYLTLQNVTKALVNVAMRHNKLTKQCQLVEQKGTNHQ
jgi:hypothetical protein